MALKDFQNFRFKPEDRINSSCPTERCDFAHSTELLHEFCKKETGSQILRIFSLETLDTLYPENEWLYVFRDGSKMTDNSNASAGVCCNLLFFYIPIGIHSTAFDAELLAIRIVLSQLLYEYHTDCGSRAALQAIYSIEASLSQ
ncbi:hypothetical protein TNCV_2762211 [Trichonephila clavipes]|nr:hypothetical protein TNCV_2762211 [Trichonephila clavipes]